MKKKYVKGEYKMAPTTSKRKITYRGIPVMVLEERRKKQISASIKTNRENRRLALVFYGGDPPKCACCNEITYQFLAIDHIYGGGNQHRKLVGTNIYRWLKINSYPLGYQVLCHNCNLAKGYYGVCPHKVS